MQPDQFIHPAHTLQSEQPSQCRCGESATSVCPNCPSFIPVIASQQPTYTIPVHMPRITSSDHLAIKQVRQPHPTSRHVLPNSDQQAWLMVLQGSTPHPYPCRHIHPLHLLFHSHRSHPWACHTWGKVNRLPIQNLHQWVIVVDWAPWCHKFRSWEWHSGIYIWPIYEGQWWGQWSWLGNRWRIGRHGEMKSIRGDICLNVVRLDSPDASLDSHQYIVYMFSYIHILCSSKFNLQLSCWTGFSRTSVLTPQDRGVMNPWGGIYH